MKSKLRSFCFFAVFFFVLAPAMVWGSAYESFQAKAKTHETELEVEGLSYMAGGGVGLGMSLGLGIASSEIFPKVGYSLIQTLSSAAIAYGAILYYSGDDFTREAEKLSDFAKSLSIVHTLTAAQKSRIMDEATNAAVTRALERRNTIRRIRGVLELTTAAAAGATLGFSKTSATASNVSLGFIILITTIGGASDLLFTDSASRDFKEVFTAGLLPDPAGPGLSLTYRF